MNSLLTKSSRHKAIWPILLFVPVLATTSLFAQSTALLSGTVVDSSGAAIPNAEVSCKNRQTSLTYHVVTDASGLFRFPDLPIGTYDVTASSSGLSSAVNQDVALVTGHSVDLVLQLQIGSTVQTTTVSDTVQIIQPTSSELQTSVESKNMTDLPLNGRNPSGQHRSAYGLSHAFVVHWVSDCPDLVSRFPSRQGVKSSFLIVRAFREENSMAK